MSVDRSGGVRKRGAKLAGGVLCLMFIAVSGCVDTMPDVKPLPPPEVTMAQPIQREILESREFPGRVAAVENVELRARVTGYLTEVNIVGGGDIAEGDIVEAGTELFKIDPRPFQEKLNAAKADVARFEAMIAKNKADLDRQTKLLKSGAGTQEDYDQAKAFLLESQAGLAGAQADVERAQLDLDFTTITAPVDGRVGSAMVTKGNLVTADQTFGTPLTTLVSVNPMYVYFNVDENTILEVRDKSRQKNPDAPPKRVSEQLWPVFIGLANEKGFPHKGYIDFVDNQVDTSTGTVRVRGRFENEDEYLRAGLFVRVQVPLSDEPEKKFLVPQTVIGTELNLKFVYVVNGDVAEKRPVELGTLTDDGLQVVETGLNADDWVIISGLQRVQDGGKVTPTERKMKPLFPGGELNDASDDAADPAEVDAEPASDGGNDAATN